MPVEEEVDAAVDGPDRQYPAAQCLVDADSPSARHQGDLAAGQHAHVELDRGALRGGQDGRFDDVNEQLELGDCLFGMLVTAPGRQYGAGRD
ncbi:hypothetical protein ACFV2Z_35765 [Streptomyces sp. NPDC059688]|uniref:hypothetical protein n=1 Tax=Streptomyces sp. NPDC059688 TaxID=3346906 RepID=UPI0036B8141A